VWVFLWIYNCFSQIYNWFSSNLQLFFADLQLFFADLQLFFFKSTIVFLQIYNSSLHCLYAVLSVLYLVELIWNQLGYYCTVGTVQPNLEAGSLAPSLIQGQAPKAYLSSKPSTQRLSSRINWTWLGWIQIVQNPNLQLPVYGRCTQGTVCTQWSALNPVRYLGGNANPNNVVH